MDYLLRYVKLLPKGKPMDRVKEIIKQMRKEAKDLRADTQVSINESIANEITARELEHWADKLEAVAGDSGKA